MVGFKSDIVQWVSKVGERLEQVPIVSAKILLDDVRIPVKQGGNMPVLTGNLRNSADVSFTGSRAADKILDPDNPLPDPTSRLHVKLEKARIGQTISIFFRAIYGPRMELKYAFVRLSGQKWPQIVDQAVARIRKFTP